MNDTNQSADRKRSNKNRGPRRPKTPYRVVTVSFAGRTDHQETADADHAYAMFFALMDEALVLYCAIFKDGQLIRDDVKQFHPVEEVAEPAPVAAEPEVASREQLEALAEARSTR